MRVSIQDTLERLLRQEDTDGDKKITIEDKGPKSFELREGEEVLTISGTYQLSILLQELVIAEREGKTYLDFDGECLKESPEQRTSRMIREYYWDGLTRRMDESGITQLLADTKNAELQSDQLLIYVPYHDELAKKYYESLAKDYPLKVIRLPEQVTPQFVQSINRESGILSLRLIDNADKIEAIPFVVPGGRFNEMYGWDSYFQNIGLLIDGKVELAKGVVDNFQYEIESYGKILNANRSYYLTRTQPPFYSSMIREVFEQTEDWEWLTSHLKTAIREYDTVWMEQGKRLTANGLNRYLAEGIGITPESEESHYDTILEPFVSRFDCSLAELRRNYIDGKVQIEELNDYFVHDRSVRESGHDTSYRLEGICADLNPVELNCMLYKYETDFAQLTKDIFGGTFDGRSVDYWEAKAARRKELMNELLWSEDDGIYYDFNHVAGHKHRFMAATCFFPLWAGIADNNQAEKMVESVLPQLIERGGIAGCTREARGEINEHRPQRQWDYPNGWAPHQMIIWKGLIRYGYTDLAKNLITRWTSMITTNAMNYNGTIPEKYDVVEATHKVFAEYGNVGTDFEYITQEGFGWMNASYQYGLKLLRDM